MFHKKKLFSINSYILLTSLTLALGLFVLPAKSVLAKTTTITESKTLAEDINGPVVIGADDITLDCHSHKIAGPGGHNSDIGIYLNGKNNVTVKNCAIEGFGQGIYLENSDNNTITKNNISSNSSGISFVCSSDNEVLENNIFHNALGMGISNVCLDSNNLTYHNNFKSNGQQVAIDYPHNDLFDNGKEGNYWSDYSGEDADGNGLGDTSYPIPPFPYMDSSVSTGLYDNYPFVNENGWKKEELPKWRKNIEAGDILYDPFASGVGHVGLYVGDSEVVEALGVPPWKVNYPGKVEENPIIDWDYPQKDTVYLLRVKKPDDFTDEEWKKKINNAIDFVQSQYKEEKPYDWHWNKKQYDVNSPSWYCSELVWAAYFNQGVDLEANSSNTFILIPTPLGVPIFTSFSPVTPAEIFHDKDTKIISSHLEGSDSVPWYKEFAPLFILSPVNVIITDKNGDVLSKSKNAIPGATFIENQTETSGHKYSLIYLPVEYGPYKIEVVRKSEANDGDVYSLKTQTDNGDVWLAKNHLVPGSGEEHKYNFDPVALNKDSGNDNNISTTGGFSDTEKSSGNTFQAETLDFSIPPASDFYPKVSSSQEATRSVSIKKDGSENFKYRVSAKNFSGDKDFCDTLEIKDDLGNNYQDLKSYLSSNTDNVAKTDWKFTTRIKSDSDVLSGKTCKFDLVFQGWQENINDYGDGGFTDEETISGTVKSEEEVVPSPPEPGDVIINEVMWMGSQKDSGTLYRADEWIELKNTTNHDIDIKNWNINNAVNGNNGHLEIAGGSTDIIPAGKYFLISDKNRDNSRIDVNSNLISTNINLDNNYLVNEKLILKDKNGNIIDETPDPINNDWTAGKNINHQRWSMERNDDPNSGWHTCDPSKMNATELNLMKSYWDSDAQKYNCGTPGAENLSENDPSSSLNPKNIQEPKNLEPPVQELSPAESVTTKPKKVETGDGETEKIITKEVKINLTKELKLPENFESKIDQKIEKVEIKGEKEAVEKISDKQLAIDLSKIKKEKLPAVIEIKIKDLDLPEGIEIINCKEDEIIAEIKITEKIITQDIDIEIKGKLDLADGLKIEDESFEQKIKKIKLKGTVSELKNIGDKIVINLDKLDKIKEAEKFEFKIKDLNLPDKLVVTDYTTEKNIFEVTIKEKDKKDSNVSNNTQTQDMKENIADDTTSNSVNLNTNNL